MEPVFAGASRRWTAGDAQDRALRLACRTVGPGGRLRADHRVSRVPASRWRCGLSPGGCRRCGTSSVGVIERPQSKSPDFYRELGDIFAVKLAPHNRWGGFKALRERWKTHVASSRISPVLLIDEAQEMSPDVLGELRILSSADFDATSLLTVVLSGDGRLLELLRQEDLVPLGTRIRTRLVTETATREDLLGAAPPRAGQGRQRNAHDGRAHGYAGRSQRGQLSRAHDHRCRALGLRQRRTSSRSLTKSVTWRSISPGTHAPRSRRK